MKKLLAFVLCAVMLTGLLAACGGSSQPDSPDATTTVPTTDTVPTGALLLSSSILELMEEQEYPKCFGGCYPDADAVVILTTDKKELRSRLKDLLKEWDKDSYSYREVDVSYRKLLEVEQQVYDNMDILEAMGVPITSVSIDVPNSRVSVGIVNLNSGSKKAITELVISPLLYLYDSKAESE